MSEEIKALPPEGSTKCTQKRNLTGGSMGDSFVSIRRCRPRRGHIPKYPPAGSPARRRLPPGWNSGLRVLFSVCYYQSPQPLATYNALFVPMFAMGGLLCLVMSALFRQAAELKAENDLTI